MQDPRLTTTLSLDYAILFFTMLFFLTLVLTRRVGKEVERILLVLVSGVGLLVASGGGWLV